MNDLSAQPNTYKLAPPDYAFASVPIAAFTQLADPRAVPPKIVGLVAPVGYGKSVSMAMLHAAWRHGGRRCAWIGLDEHDCTADQLIGLLEIALLDPEAAPARAHALFVEPTALELRLARLLAQLASRAQATTLFLDNLQFCTDADQRRVLDALAWRTPPNFTLVVSSTRELPLDMARARLEKLIQLLGPRELSLQRAEVAELLGPELRQRLGPAGIARVTDLTEGWPAAVRMAQIILLGSDAPLEALRSLTRSDQVLTHLLNDQVLSSLGAELRTFLLAIAPLRIFGAELCRLATSDPHAAQHLEFLIERNVFIVPVDRSRGWYRLHGLFRDHLLREAEHALAPRQRRQLLERAALWCEAHGQPRDAIDYALASGSTLAATRVLERLAPSFVRDRGDVRQYIDWLEKLHRRRTRAGPEAEYWFAWALAFDRQYDQARQQIRTLAARIRRQQRNLGRGGRLRDLAHRIAILKASVESLTDHPFAAYAEAERWLASADPARDDPFNFAAAHCIACGHHANLERFADAHRSLQAARAAATLTQSAYVEGWVAAYAGMVACFEGSYDSGLTAAVDALARVRSALGDDAGIAGAIALVAARCAAGMARDAQARELLEFGLRGSNHHGFLEAAACGVEAALLLWDGADTELLPQLERLARAYPPRLALTLETLLLRRLVWLGRAGKAATRAAQPGSSKGAPRPREVRAARTDISHFRSLLTVTRAELLISQGRMAWARRLVVDESQRVRRCGSIARLVELSLADAMIAVRASDPAQALRGLARALRLAAARGIVQPFLERAAALGPLLLDSTAARCGLISEAERRFHAGLLERLRNEYASGEPGKASAPDAAHRHLAELTAREDELLQLLAFGLTNQQLADRIDTSVATVKWHLQNLFAKLEVANRTAALARGHELGRMRR